MQAPLTAWVQDAELNPPVSLPKPQIVPFGWDWKAFHSALLTAHARGEAPDLVEVGNTWTSRLMAEGLLLDITRFATEQLNAASLFFPRLLRYCIDGSNGRYYALPLLADARILFYNQDLVEPYLATHPRAFQNWDAFEDMCRAVQDALRTRSDAQREHETYAFAWPLGQDAFHDILPWVMGMGGDFVAATGDVLLDSECTRNAILRMARLVLTGCAPAAPYPPAKDLGELGTQFRLQRIAIVACGLWLMHGRESWIKSCLHPPSPYPVAFVGGSNVGIVRKHSGDEMSEEYKPAKQLLESSLTILEHQVHLARTRGKIPSTTSAWKRLEELEQDPSMRPVLETFGRAMALGSDRGLPNVPNLVDVEEALKDCMRRVWLEVGKIKRSAWTLPAADLDKKCCEAIADELSATRRLIEPLLSGCTIHYTRHDIEQLGLRPPATFDIWLELHGTAANARGDVYVSTTTPINGIGQTLFQLLLALVNAPRRTVSRDALIRDVWGHPLTRDHQRLKAIYELSENLNNSLLSMQTSTRVLDARVQLSHAADLGEEIGHIAHESVVDRQKKLDTLRHALQNLNAVLRVPLGITAIEQRKDQAGEVFYRLNHDLSVCVVHAE